MLQLFRRFVVLQSLMLWQGGFLFYALIVVPIGAEVLGSAIDQGYITRRVTVWLNGCGAACLALYAFDAWTTMHYRRSRLILSIMSAILLFLHIVLHRILDDYLDPGDRILKIQNREEFYRWHAYYLILSGVLWLAMLAAAGLMLAAWRASDAAIRCRETPPEPS